LENGREIALPGDTYDLASIVYALRRVDLTPGKQATNLTVLEDGRLYTLRVAPDGNEKAYTRAGTFDATKLAIRVVENDRAGDSHRLRLFVTRDARRLPVLLTAEPSWGEIRMELTSVEKSVSPADPRLAR
jgi:hypothetical protein